MGRAKKVSGPFKDKKDNEKSWRQISKKIAGIKKTTGANFMMIEQSKTKSEGTTLIRISCTEDPMPFIRKILTHVIQMQQAE
jgi:hypothetical protein